MKKIKEFFGNVNQEFKKITWPTGKEMKLHSIQVFVFMIVLSLFFAGVDAIISTSVAAATRDNVVEYDYDDDDYDYDYDVDENGDED